MGDRIRLARYEKGLGKAEFAKIMDISLARLRILEDDSRLPNEEEQLMLERILSSGLRMTSSC